MRVGRWLLLFAMLISVVPAKAEPTREFIMSATYGVLAGTLVGAATLAFTDNPGDNLRNIARGASYGLYAGILLGLYVVYGVPGEGDSDLPPPEDLPPPPTMDDDNYNDQSLLRKQMPKLRVSRTVTGLFPVISAERGIEGAGFALRYNF